MSQDGHVSQLTKLIDGRLVATMKTAKHALPPPISTMALLRQLKAHIEQRMIFATLCDCALLGELIFASSRGSIYKLSESTDVDEQALHEPLLALRNACLHPANVGADPTLPALVEALRNDDRQLHKRLNQDWSLIHTSVDLAKWALLKLHAVGRYELKARGLWWPTQTK